MPRPLLHNFPIGTEVGHVTANEIAIDARIRAALAVDRTITIDDSVFMSERTQLSGGGSVAFSLYFSRAR